MMHCARTMWPFRGVLALKLPDTAKQTLTIMFSLILFISALTADSQPVKLVNDLPIHPGEQLEFRLSYGWFTVGQATWVTEKNFVTSGGEKCYKIKVTAGSSGLLGVFAKVDDEWGEHMRVRDFMPMMAYRDLEEGKYILDEKTYFNYDSREIRTEAIRKGKEKPTKYFTMDKDRLGMLGGFTQMRCVDYDKYKPGDRIKIEAFFEGEPYNLDLIYKGKEQLKSKVGKLWTYKLVPLMPENRLFPGKEPITVWISADKNRLPLRADANMYFGTAYVELTNYKNIKFGPDYQD